MTLNVKDCWQRLYLEDEAGIAALESELGLDLSTVEAFERDDLLCLPLLQIVFQQNRYAEAAITVIMTPERLITVEAWPLSCLNDLYSSLGDKHLDPPQIFFEILYALNEAARGCVRRIAVGIDAFGHQALAAGGGFDDKGKQSGVADIADSVAALSEMEELVAKSADGQLHLARAGRWLQRYLEDKDQGTNLNLMLSDIKSLKRFALFQHEKIRNLEESLMTTLDLKQNQITKVFTVITAVFSPPTLVAAFYGQNFSYMPELALDYAEWIVIAMTAIAALAPMLYIKRKGWMR